MKVLCTLLIYLCLMLFAKESSNALELESFLAKDGFQTAFDYAQNTLGFSDPELLAVGTAIGETVILGTVNKIGMDISDGKSKGWSYVFVSRQSHIIAIVGVGKFGSFQARDITNEIEGFVVDTSSTEIGENWIDSDELSSAISANGEYQTYIATYPSAKPDAVVLQKNYLNSELKQDYPYWMATFGKPQDFVCYTDALTGETVCKEVAQNHVKPFEQVANSFSPNPATNSINLHIGKHPISISIIDMLGAKAFQTRDKQINNIDLTNLSSGIYTVVYEYQNRIETEKLIINK